MSLRDQQIEREESSASRGAERVFSQAEKDRAAGRLYDNGPGSVQINDLVQESLAAIEELQKESVARTRRAMGVTKGGKGHRITPYDVPVTCLPAEVLAFLTIKTMLNTAGNGWPLVRIAQTVGDIVETEWRWSKLRKAESGRLKEGEGVGYNRITYLKKTVKAVNPRAVKKWLKRLEDLEAKGWPKEDRVKVGLNLVHAVIARCPTVFERDMVIEYKYGKPKTKTLIKIHEDPRKALDGEIKRLALNTPWMMPMIHPPIDWTDDQLGGYLTERLKVDLVKSMNGESYQYADDVPQVVMDAVNAIQRTPWVIHTHLLDLAERAHEMAKDAPREALIHKVLPVQVWLEQAPEYPEVEWEAMSDQEKSAVRAKRKEIHDSNFSLQSKREVVQRQMAAATECRDFEAIYFPHNLDWRGRVYPLPQDLHPQADDFGKSLLRFAEAKRIGQRGFDWLCYTVAGTYGLDKEDRETQQVWVFEHQDQIRQLVADPLGAGLEFWVGADEPWQFLASCIELVNALDVGLDYECSLPIYVDGSCNGLQHLSAMAKDPEGAATVNLCAGPRQDIYEVVADKVACAVALSDGMDGPPKNWQGKVTRKVVKRAVMTVPYGLTYVGARDQMISDRPKTWADVEGDWRENATYIRDLTMTAIEGTVEKACGVMNWLQDTASIMAKAKAPLVWTAPTGFRVTQRYLKPETKVYTLLGVFFKKKTKVHLTRLTEDLWLTKQRQSISPNVVHSFDAAHLQMSIASAANSGVISAIAAVHDSFGTHACDMDGLVDVIKDTFVEIYSGDVLADLHHEFAAQATAHEVDDLPPPPALGDFEVDQVRRSDWFFA